MVLEAETRAVGVAVPSDVVGPRSEPLLTTLKSVVRVPAPPDNTMLVFAPACVSVLVIATSPLVSDALMRCR